MATTANIRRAVATMLYGHTCIYCGKDGLHLRALYLDPLFGREHNVPICGSCRGTRPDGDATEFLQAHLRRAELHVATLRTVMDRYGSQPTAAELVDAARAEKRAATNSALGDALLGWDEVEDEAEPIEAEPIEVEDEEDEVLTREEQRAAVEAAADGW